MYCLKTLTLFEKADFSGLLKGNNGIGIAKNEIDGSEAYKFYLKIDEESKEILDASFKTFGGVVAIACSSVAAKFVIGKHIDSATEGLAQKIAAEVCEVISMTTNCIELIEEAILNAVVDFNKKLLKAQNN